MEPTRPIRKSDMEYFLNIAEKEGRSKDDVIETLKRAAEQSPSFKSRLFIRQALATLGVTV
jgi:hypothetical protein